MTQEGMPIRFQAWDEKRGKFVRPSEVTDGIIPVKTTKEGFELKTKFILLQAIGATSSDVPKQELHLEDVIEFYRGGIKEIGIIVWKDFQVMIKFYRVEIRYLEFIGRMKYGITKLGSRHDPKIKDVLEKAGLEEK